MLSQLPFILRIAQASLAFILMVLTASSFKIIRPDVKDGLSSQLGSATFTFVLLLSYTIWIVSTACSVGMITKNSALRLPRKVSLTFDGASMIMTFAAGVAASVSDYVQSCSMYNAPTIFLRCGMLNASCVFCFLLMLVHIASLVIVAIPEKFNQIQKSIPCNSHPERQSMGANSSMSFASSSISFSQK